MLHSHCFRIYIKKVSNYLVLVCKIYTFTKNQLTFNIMKKLLLTGFALVSIVTQAQSWVPQATKFPANFGVDELVIVDPNTVWTFAYDGSGGGTYPKIISKTTNGSTWTASNITGLPATALVSDISAIDASNAWIVTAPSGTVASANGIWKTSNGGTTWTRQNAAGQYTNASSFANHVYFWDADNGWTSGDPVAGKFEMFKTSNGGATWTSVPGALAPESSDEFTYVGVKKVVGDNIWVGTSTGRVLRSNDRGTTWAGDSSPVLDFGGVITAGSSGSFAFKNASNGLLLAVDGDSAFLYSTADGGASWDPVTPNGTWFFGDIAYVPGTPNTYVSTGINSNAEQGTGSSYSTDGGLTWTIIDNIPGVEGGQRGKVQFLNPTTGWCGYFSDGPAGSAGIFKFSGNLNLGVASSAVNSGLQIYPNPATDVVNISTKKAVETINVFDLSGKKVKSFKSAGQINVSSLAKGTYILQVYYGGGSVETTKLIKK